MKWDADVHALEVVFVGARQFQPVGAELARELIRVVQVTIEVGGSQRRVVGVQTFPRGCIAGENHFAAQAPRTRSKVHEVVSGPHDVFVVFNDDNGVAEIAELLEDANEAFGVLRVEADARFVKDVGATDQAAAEAGAQRDALRFAAAEGFAGAVQGQVTDPDFAQVAQPRFRLLEESLPNFGFRWREFQALGPFQGIGSGHAQHFRQGAAADEYVLCAFAQARAVARGARGAATVPAEHDAELNFVALLLEVGEKRVEPLESFATFPDQGLLGFSEFTPGAVDGDVVVASGEAEALLPFAHALPAPAGDGVVVDAEFGIGHHALRIDADDVSKAFAPAAGTDGAVEGEQFGAGFGECDSVPFEAVGESPRFSVAVGKPDFARAVPFKKGRFDGIENAGVEIAFVVGCGRDQAVHDEPPGVDVRSDGVGDGVGVARCVHDPAKSLLL